MIVMNGQVGTAFKTQKILMGTIMKHYMIMFINMGKFLFWLSQWFKCIFSVCEDPIYIEAREVSTEKDWIGSGSLIIHQVKNTADWAFGFSKDFGWVGKIEIIFMCYDLLTKN